MTTTAGAEHAYLFDAQLLMLDDAMLVERAADTIRNERLNAESALQRALDHISAFFDEAHDPYLRERKGDVADVVGRLTMNLRAGRRSDGSLPGSGGSAGARRARRDAVAHRAARLARLAGLVTDAGSWTNHTAILARSLRVPAVAGLHNASVLVAPGTVVAVDGTTGEMLVDPDRRDAGADRRTAAAPSGARADARRVPRPAGRHRRRHRDSTRGEHRGARTMRRARASVERRASGCFAPSSCSPAAARRR